MRTPEFRYYPIKYQRVFIRHEKRPMRLIPQHPLSLLEIIGILFTKCSKRTTLYRQTSEQVRSVFSHLPIFESQIPATVQVGTANSKGLSVMELDAKSPAAAAYMNLAKEVLAYA